MKGKKVSSIYGNYCGYLDIDGKRWWDLRDVAAVYHLFRGVASEESLPSDATKRKDAVPLLTGDQE